MNSLHGSPHFLDMMIPVTKLNADFLLHQIISCTQTVESAGGKVQAIICDGNRTNQAFFKKLKTQENKLWISEESTSFSHDYVHLLKSFRNRWLTERNGELKFVLNDEILVARWQDLRDLHHQVRSKG